MSSNRAGLQWQWSATLQAWYYHDSRRNVYVTEDGRTLPLQASQGSHEPRALPSTTDRGDRDLLHDRTASYGSTGSGAQYGIAPGADPGLNAMMGNLQVSTAEPEATVLRGFDQNQGIETRYQIYPPEEITQPELFEKGFTARAKVLRTRGSQEELDPGRPQAQRSANVQLTVADFRLRKAPRKFFVVGKV